MPRHVRQKGRPNRSKRPTARKRQWINYRLLLKDIQARASVEEMTSSKTKERRHRNCLL